MKTLKKWLKNYMAKIEFANTPVLVDPKIIKPCPFCDALAHEFGTHYFIRHFDWCFLNIWEPKVSTIKKKDIKKIAAYNKREH